MPALKVPCSRCQTAHPAWSLCIGERLEERYLLEQFVGAGGMGAVYRARDLELNRHVAIKLIDAQTGDALREARMAARPKHRHIVDVYDYRKGPPAYIVMEWLEGRDLARLVAAEGTVAWPRALRLMIQVSRAVAAAHGHAITHYDLKPANLFVEGAPPHEFIKLLDFGIAQGSDGQSSSRESVVKLMGTPEYMAPERLRKGHASGEAADIFSLGVILYELVGGKRPDTRGPLRPLPGAPHLLDEIVRRATAHAPAERFASADELVCALEGCLRHGEPARASEGSPTTSSLGETGPILERNHSLSALVPETDPKPYATRRARGHVRPYVLGSVFALVLTGALLWGKAASRRATTTTLRTNVSGEQPARVPSASVAASAVPAPPLAATSSPSGGLAQVARASKKPATKSRAALEPEAVPAPPEASAPTTSAPTEQDPFGGRL